MKSPLKKLTYGISLIELMLSIFIGSLLVVGMLNLFLSNKTTYKMQEGLARLQESGRFAEYFISKNLRMAGFQGCSNQQNIVAVNLISAPTADMVFAATDAIKGYESAAGGGWTPALPAHISAKGPEPGTDIVVVRYGDENNIPLTVSQSSAASALTVDNRFNFVSGQPLLITDCETAQLFKASAGTNGTTITHTTANNTNNAFTKAYLLNTKVSAFRAYTYYIKNTGRTNTAGQRILSLYRLDINGTEEELVEGVENLQILYGIDSDEDGSVDSYSAANAINAASQWNLVKGVKVSLLINSIEPASPEVKSYTFNNATTTPTDRLIRRQWDSYIAIRNRNL